MKPFVLNGLPSLLNQPPAASLMRCPTCDYEPKTAEDQIKHSMSHFFDRAASITNAQNGTGNGGHATNGNANGQNGSEGNGNGNSALSNLYSGLSQVCFGEFNGKIDKKKSIDNFVEVHYPKFGLL